VTGIASATLFTVGDLVFLYLAQDGSFDLSDTPSFGGLNPPSSTTNAGKWQINRVAGVQLNAPNTDVFLECDLDPSFVNVPVVAGYHRMVITQFIVANTLTLQPFVKITPPAAFTPVATTGTNLGGGVVPILARSIVMTDGTSINADHMGFAGPGIINGGSLCFCPGCKTQNYVCSSASNCGARKGSSIVPYADSLVPSHLGRGAMANGGGGGGGANVCANANDYQWTGDGVSCFVVFSLLTRISNRLDPSLLFFFFSSHLISSHLIFHLISFIIDASKPDRVQSVLSVGRSTSQLYRRRKRRVHIFHKHQFGSIR